LYHNGSNAKIQEAAVTNRKLVSARENYTIILTSKFDVFTLAA